MRSAFLWILFSGLILNSCKPAALSQAEMAEKIKDQATEMGTALMKKDCEKVVDFSYPELIKQAGETVTFY